MEATVGLQNTVNQAMFTRLREEVGRMFRKRDKAWASKEADFNWDTQTHSRAHTYTHTLVGAEAVLPAPRHTLKHTHSNIHTHTEFSCHRRFRSTGGREIPELCYSDCCTQLTFITKYSHNIPDVWHFLKPLFRELVSLLFISKRLFLWCLKFTLKIAV